MGRVRIAAFIVVVGLPALGALAAPEPTLYTNSDLAKFGASTAPLAAPGRETDTGWAQVQDFIDREYERIDAERAHSLALLESDRRDLVAVDTALSDRWYPLGYWAPYANGYWGGGWGHSSRVPCGVPDRSARALVERSVRAGVDRHRAFLNYRPTIHAQPPFGHGTVPQGPSFAPRSHGQGRGHR